MAGSNYKKSGSRSRSSFQKVPKQYFSPQPPKADRKAIKAMLTGNPQRVLDFLAGTEKSERISSWWDDENGTCVVSYSVGSAPGSDVERCIMGRASNLLNAIAIIVHWLDTLDMAYMFPDDDEDDEDAL